MVGQKHSCQRQRLKYRLVFAYFKEKICLSPPQLFGIKCLLIR